MAVEKVIWWQHNSKSGQYSSAKVHKTLISHLKKGLPLDTLGIEKHRTRKRFCLWVGQYWFLKQ